jgi:hypothetical protein
MPSCLQKSGKACQKVSTAKKEKAKQGIVHMTLLHMGPDRFATSHPSPSKRKKEHNMKIQQKSHFDLEEK